MGRFQFLNVYFFHKFFNNQEARNCFKSSAAAAVAAAANNSHVYVFFVFFALFQKMAAKEQFLPVISLLIITNTKKGKSAQGTSI